MEHYQEVRGAVYDVAETLKHKHCHAFFFLAGPLNNILNTPIYYNISGQKMLASVRVDERRKGISDETSNDCRR
ncbi:hypothetical protein SDC9_160315 [bioreactor metagenome]|uniref:Uncharacterized protein n=1 Tax=bioreactor metagenome TaxID=1076179 RepID=A0A645FF20_9ZZZZ